MDSRNHPRASIGVDNSNVIATHITILPSAYPQDHHPTIIRVIIRKILEASLGVDHPLWSILGANSQSISGIATTPPNRLI
tara:strand:- start:3262 stop:3504 length:243 start_codon:yes stop_codon:yes gene_type:complete